MRAPPVHSEPLRVLVVAADPLVRTGLAVMLASAPEGFVVSQASAALGYSMEQSRPEVVVWDAGADPEPGLQLGAGEAAPILALVPDEGRAWEALAAGVAGALPRDAPGETIAAALSALGRGLGVLDRSFLAALPSHPNSGAAPLREPLTPREREVLFLLAEGLSNKEVAARLSISEHTAKFHVNAVLAKLGVGRRIEAVVRAARLGIIDL